MKYNNCPSVCVEPPTMREYSMTKAALVGVWGKERGKIGPWTTKI